MAFAFPLLDLSDLDKGDTAAAAFRSALLEATHNVGFFYLTGTGLTPTLETRMLSTAKAFFALPLSDKLSIENIKSPGFRGYTRLGGERTLGATDNREMLDIWPERAALSASELSTLPPYYRLVGPNLWPAALPSLAGVADEWMGVMNSAARRLLRAWAEALGAQPDYFDRHFQDPTSRLKIVRYPAGEGQGVGAHKDGGCVTLLYVEPGVGGLQIRPDERGEWIDAPPAPPGAVVCNIGEMVELATRGYLKATPHRVVGGVERISVPMFINPDLDAVFDVIELQGARRVGTDDDPIFERYGDNLLKSRLRAHPDVAAIWHPDLVST